MILFENILNEIESFDTFRNRTISVPDITSKSKYHALLKSFKSSDKKFSVQQSKYHYPRYIDDVFIVAHNDEGTPIGFISFWSVGKPVPFDKLMKIKKWKVDLAFVAEEYRRQHIASSIFDYVRTVLKKNIIHSNALTDLGAKLTYNDRLKNEK